MLSGQRLILNAYDMLLIEIFKKKSQILYSIVMFIYLEISFYLQRDMYMSAKVIIRYILYLKGMKKEWLNSLSTSASQKGTLQTMGRSRGGQVVRTPPPPEKS